MWRKHHIYLVIRSVRNEVLCVSTRGDAQERNIVGKSWIFPTQEGGESMLFLIHSCPSVEACLDKVYVDFCVIIKIMIEFNTWENVNAIMLSGKNI